MVGCTSEGSLQEETGLRLAREDVGRLAERGEGKRAQPPAGAGARPSAAGAEPAGACRPVCDVAPRSRRRRRLPWTKHSRNWLSFMNSWCPRVRSSVQQRRGFTRRDTSVLW